MIKDLFAKHGTDKLEHGYADYYEKHLPKQANKILEIGVKEGNSIRAWMELYPTAKIYGLDLFGEYKPPFSDDRVTWFTGSQSDGELLNIVRHHAPFDVIIDDGSHNHRDQLITFFGLWGLTKLYVVEDIEQNEFWSQGLPLEDNIKSLNVATAKIYNYDKIKFFFAK